jgi:hypothetical protein
VQMIFYPGDVNQPCQAEYGIAITREPSITRVDIVVIDPREAGLHQSSLLNTDLSRDLVLNKIFLIDLLGIRIDFMRFFVIVDAESPFGMDGYEFPVRLDFEDYRQKGNPVQIKKVAPTSIKGWLRYVLGFHVKRVSALSRDVVGGCATVKTDPEHVRHMTAAEARLLLTAVGYQARWTYRGLRLVPSR